MYCGYKMFSFLYHNYIFENYEILSSGKRLWKEEGLLEG